MASLSCKELDWETMYDSDSSLGIEVSEQVISDKFLSAPLGSAFSQLCSRSASVQGRRLRESADFFATVSSIEVSVPMAVKLIAISRYRKPRARNMKNLFDFDTKDLAFMVGLSSLAGAVLSEASSMFLGQPPTPIASLVVVLISFIGGRFLSEKLRHDKHG